MEADSSVDRVTMLWAWQLSSQGLVTHGERAMCARGKVAQAWNWMFTSSHFFQSCKSSQLAVQFFVVRLFLFSTRFGRLCAHRQEKQLYLCDNWYLLFCVDDCLVCRVIHTE